MLWFLIVLVLLLSDHVRSAGVVALVYLLVRFFRAAGSFRRNRSLGDESFWNDAFRLLGHLSRSSDAAVGRAAEALAEALGAYGVPAEEIERNLRAWHEGRHAASAEVETWTERWRRAAPRHGLGVRLFAELALRQHVLLHRTAPPSAELTNLLASLGLHPLELEALHTRVLLEEEWRRMNERMEQAQGGTRGPSSSESSLAEAYATLGVRPEASDEEVTLAYRRLLRRHHPDKIAASGASDLAVRMANDRTQRIRAAYERIRAVRGRPA
jgi:DnaJ like chaperone protein